MAAVIQGFAPHVGAWAQDRSCRVHQSPRRKLQQITATHHVRLELSGPVSCSEELHWGGSSAASVPAARLHLAGSAGLTTHGSCAWHRVQAAQTSHEAVRACLSQHLYITAVRLFLRASVGKVLGPASFWQVHLGLEVRIFQPHIKD